MSAVTGALPFIGLAPCRILDTRGNGAPITGGMFMATEHRDYAVAGICGIPASAQALSLNITVAGPGQTGPGFLLTWPTGGTPPPVSTLNWDHVPATLANAAVVPTNASVSFTVNVSSPTHVIIDVNGYYGNPTADLSNVFLGPVAGNTAVSGLHNVGIGTGALESLTSGSDNTAVGTDALLNNTIGIQNTALGTSTLRSNVGAGNTAVGREALFVNNSGNGNTAVGTNALHSNVFGAGNVAIGYQALISCSSASDNNIAVGYQAASNLTSGSHNIHIGNPGLSSESNTVRIGTGGVHTKFFVAGVRNVTTGQADGVPVYIDGLAQLGTISSSARVKKEIADVGEESSVILKLRPVSFLYRNDTIGIRQYGLIAEEVAAVMPELVQLSEAGEPEMVRYHFLTPLLLNELQKQQKTIEHQNEVIAGLEARLEALEARLLAESRP